MSRLRVSAFWALMALATASCLDSGRTSKPSATDGGVANSSVATKAESPINTVTTSTDTGESATRSAPEQDPRPKCEPIYETQTPGVDLIKNAIRKAQRDHKRVLIEWGFNSCIWCVRLHEVFKKDAQVQPLVYEEYVLVLVDSTTNGELLREYGGQDRRYSFPHLTILDETGKVITNQNTEPLEKGDGHDPKVVAEFLTKWAAPKLDAEEVVVNAFKQATTEGKRVFVRVGNPYCGWCNILAQFMQDHSELFGKDYVDIKIDTLRMTNGEAVASRYQPAAENGLGVPWVVVLDESGKTLASSVGPKGNIGYPYQLPEIEYFIGMLRETRQKLTDAELDQLRSDLVKFHDDREGKKN